MAKTGKPVGAQFVRIEHYAIRPSNHARSRKGGNHVSFVVREFLRAPGSSPHVPIPQPPVLLLGDFDQVQTLPARLLDGARKVRSATGRKQRIDCPVLMPIIFSHPSTEISTEYLAWEKDTLDFVQRHFQGKVEAVARHSDESRLHLHALIHDGGRRVLGLSPGRNAEGKRSIKALREFQDRYYEEVGRKNNLTRLGPRRTRLVSTREHKMSAAISESLQRDIQRNQAMLKRQKLEMEVAANEASRLARRRAAMKSHIEAETTELQFLMAAKAETEKSMAQREADLLAKERDVEQLLDTLEEHELVKVREASSVPAVKRFTRKSS